MNVEKEAIFEMVKGRHIREGEVKAYRNVIRIFDGLLVEMEMANRADLIGDNSHRARFIRCDNRQDTDKLMGFIPNLMLKLEHTLKEKEGRLHEKI